MKNACILILFVFLTFLAESSADLTIVGPNVSASASALEGYETYILETYETASQSDPTDTADAGYDLSVTVSASASGKGYFSIHAAGDLYKYSSPYHPAGETPSHVSALEGESQTRIKVGSGWPIIIFSGLKSADVSAEGTLITDVTGKYEVKGKGKVDTSAGGGSGSGGGIGGGTSAVSTTGDWVSDATDFRVSVVEVRLSPQANSQSGCANDPNNDWCTDSGVCSHNGSSSSNGSCGHRWCLCTIGSQGTSSSSSSSGCANNPNRNWCTDTGSCSTRSPSGVPGECGHNYCCCAPYGSPMYNGNSGNSNAGQSNSGNSNAGQSNNGNSGNSNNGNSNAGQSNNGNSGNSNNGDSGTSGGSSGGSDGSDSSGSGNTNSGSDDSTPTPPTPTPPTPSPPNNNEDTDDDTDDAPDAPSAPEPTRLNCGHLSTAEGNHSYQASCTSQDSNGNYCTATSFYQCQHTSHTYPAPPTPTPTPAVVCPANSWTNCGGTTSHAATCTDGHSYWTCGTANAWHQDRTCTRCSQTYQNCSNSATACQSSYWHTETPQPTLVACGAASWTGCTSQLPSATAHQVTCSGGHSYWTCGTANAWHQDRTCSRCNQTYQKCTNTATSCQGSHWHIE